MFYPSGYFRRKALDALKGHWQTALLVALIVNLPTLLMQGFSAYTGNDLLGRMQTLIITASRDGVLSEQLILDEIRTFLNSTGFWTVRGLELLAWLITPCLSLGMYKWLLDRLQGLDDPVSTVFCRMNRFFRAIGLQLLIILKVLLWMLPGIALFIYLLLPIYRSANPQVQLEALQRSYNMTLPVTLLMVVPGAMAALRHALADYILADQPESRILFCVRRSKELMKDQKKNLFFLLVSFLLWYLLELLVSSLFAGVLSLAVQMLAGLAISVYMSASITAFYLRLKTADEKHENPNAEPEPEELN